MRLIDADKLIEDIYTNAYACTNDEINKILHKQLETNIYVIDNQPTAFDVDKVVEQLEDEKMWYETHGVNMDMKKGIIGATCKAIEIVKAGGLNE